MKGNRTNNEPGGFANAAKYLGPTELAKRYGVSRTTIYNRLAKAGLKAQDGRRPRSPDPAKLRHMREEEGMTLEQIGKRYGVSRQRAHQWFKRMEEMGS